LIFDSKFLYINLETSTQRILQRQIDLRWEAFNLSRFHSNFWGNEGDLRFPVVHENLLHEGLLVENWIEVTTV
jgi:predicted unusual protein kinase regulating ubiquinone biosynthesis (AarF/ABC1/UbiB family)